METELQVAYQISEFRGLFWNFLLYWTTVSFGLMVASHIAAKSLPTIVVSLIMFLYISFSVWVGYAFYTNTIMISGFMDDLKAMGELKSHGVAAVLAVHEMAESSKVAVYTLFFAIGGTFFGTIAFLWYSHLGQRRHA